MPEVDDYDNYEGYLNAKVLLPQNGEHMRAARVVGRSKDIDGIPIGQYDPNPYMDSRVYDVMFPDGAVEQYAANVLADNLFSQVDGDGHPYMLFEKIVGHKVDKSASEPTQHNNIHKWTRYDKGVKCYVMTKSGGPNRNQITCCQTYNSVNGKLLEDIIITPKTTDHFLHRKLPPGVTDIKSVFHYYSEPTTRGHHFRIL